MDVGLYKEEKVFKGLCSVSINKCKVDKVFLRGIWLGGCEGYERR